MRVFQRERTPDPPAELGMHDGLSYSLWLPEGEPEGGVVIIHGANSAKESHYEFARGCRASGLAAVAFDQRGHGESEGALGAGALDDVQAMAALLPPGPVALRGSSMGGYVALLAAERMEADAVVAICPASHEHLLRGLRNEDFDLRADRPALEAFLEGHDVLRVVEQLRSPLLLMHAEGDEQVPVEYSESLHRAAGMDEKRLLKLPGGHHRSVQHDPELQGESLRFIRRAFNARRKAAGG
jgi:uncharacterized protein